MENGNSLREIDGIHIFIALLHVSLTNGIACLFIDIRLALFCFATLGIPILYFQDLGDVFGILLTGCNRRNMRYQGLSISHVTDHLVTNIFPEKNSTLEDGQNGIFQQLQDTLELLSISNRYSGT